MSPRTDQRAVSPADAKCGIITGTPKLGCEMWTYFFLLIYLWWLLLLFTFVPALAVGLLCGWKTASLTWRKGLVAGLAGGFVGVACSMGWYWCIRLLPPNDVIAGGYVIGSVLPIASTASTWGICRFWR